MPKILSRTPICGTRDIPKIGRKSKPRHVEMFAKTMVFTIVSDSKEILQSIAATANKAIAEHSSIVGGKTKKRAYVTYRSTVPTKIFDGTVVTDRIKDL